MKKLILILLLLPLFCHSQNIWFNSYPQGGGALPTIVLNSIVNSGGGFCSYIWTGDATSDGGSPITEKGFCWNTTGSPTIANKYFLTSSGLGSYSFSIPSFNENTTYYGRAYAINSNGVAYSNEISFTTNNKPSVSNSINQICNTGIDFVYTVNNLYSQNIVTRELFYGLNNYNENYLNAGSGNGNYTWHLVGLSPNTTYKYRLSIRTENCDVLVSESTFTTANYTAPTVTTDSYSNVTENSATLIGTTVSQGGTFTSERGIVYGTSLNPTLSDNVLYASINQGQFSLDATGLFQNTTYHFRAFATNCIATSYGSDMLFTTTGSCSRPGGLTNYNFIDIITINGSSSNITGSLATAKQAAFDYNSPMGRTIGYSGQGGQVSGSVSVGKTVYDGWNKTDCSVLADGYYLFLENDVKLSKVLHITSGVIDLFEDAIKIGDSFGGGIIGYVLQSGDTGYSSSDVNGYIVATSDQSSGINWGCLGTIIGVYSGQWIGDSNTSAILSGCSERPIAASVASSHNGGGFTDWFLPTTTELNFFVANYSSLGFSNAYYWGSNETVPNNGFGAASIQMSNGTLFGQSKNNNNRVRAVRKF